MATTKAGSPTEMKQEKTGHLSICAALLPLNRIIYPVLPGVILAPSVPARVFGRDWIQDLQSQKTWTLVTSANEVNAISCNQLISCCVLSSCVGTDSTCRCVKYIYFILWYTGWPGIYQRVSWRWNSQPQSNPKALVRGRLRAMFALNIMFDEQPRSKSRSKWDRKGKKETDFPLSQTGSPIYNR